MDKEEMTERARLGLPIYGHSNEPEWVQGAAYRNSAFSQLKFGEYLPQGLLDCTLMMYPQPSSLCESFYLPVVTSRVC